MGAPNKHALRYYLQGADELIHMDSVASVYGRNHLAGIEEKSARNIFVPYASLDHQIGPYHHYFSLLKFGIARATSDAAHEIREGLVERAEAVQLVKRVDTEQPSENTKKLFLAYADLDLA